MFSGLWLMAMPFAMGQSTWTYLGDAGRQVRVTDAIETTGGVFLCISRYDPDSLPSKVSYLTKLEATGVPISTTRLWNDERSASVWTALPSSDGTFVTAYGDMILENADRGFYSFMLGTDLEHLDSITYICANLPNPTLSNVLAMANGDRVILGSGLPPDQSYPWVTQLIKTDQFGDSLGNLRLDNTGNVVVARHALELEDGSFLLSSRGMLSLPFYSFGLASYTKINSAMQPTGGFAGPIFGNDPNEQISFTNNMQDQLHLAGLPSGNMIVSGWRGGFGVQKLSAAGTSLGTYLLAVDQEIHHPAILGCSAPVGNELLVAYMENFNWGLETGSPFIPNAPNRVRVSKLDTSLNLLCTNVLDGFDENAYYWLDRIRGTSEGGYILCGGRIDLNAPTFTWQSWAQKFGPDDCFTGFDELAGGQEAVVYPNPGTDQFTLNLNGALRNAQVVLFSVTGQAVASGWLRNGSVTISTAELLPGVYAYRVIDRAGTERASGRWVKAE